MAATTSQGKSFTLFIAGITVAAAGIAYFSTGMGKLSLVVGLIALAVSAISFFKIKPQEGKTGSVVQPIVLQLAGVASVLGGWLIVLFGIHAASSVGGRLFTTILGLVVSLIGVVVLLPLAANKNAIWKA